MSSLSDGMDVDFEVRRRDNQYVFIARQFGVVVRSKELKSGVEELERRVAIIGDDLREAGIPIPSAPDPIARGEMRLVERLTPALIIIVTVGAVLASFIVLATAPIVSVVANVRNAISTLVPGEGRSGIASVGRRGIDFVIAVSKTMEQVTPERKEELRSAIRQIAREVDMIVQDVKAQPASSSSTDDRR